MNDLRTRSRFDHGCVLKPSGAETQNTIGEAADLGSLPETVRARLTVTAASGADPTLSVTLQGSDDGESFVPLAAFPSLTAPGAAFVGIGPCAMRHYRYVSVLGGTTPSFTYTLDLTV